VKNVKARLLIALPTIAAILAKVAVTKGVSDGR
jgi:hypothetical protein